MAAAPAGDKRAITWEGTIPLLTSRFYLLDLVTAVAIAAVGVHVLVFLMGLAVEGKPAVLPWQMGAALGGGLLLLMLLTTLLVFPGGVDATFTVDDDGVVVAAGQRLRKVNRITLLLSLLGGRAVAVGSALTAQSREDTSVSYDQIRQVWFHPRQRCIEIRDVYFRMTRVFCPADRYDEVASRVREGMSRTARPGGLLSRGALLHGLGWTLLAAAAFVLSMAWAPDEMGGALLAAALTSAAAGWSGGTLARVLGGASLASALGAGLVGLRLALASTDFGAGIVIHGYDHDETFLLITAIGTGVLALVGAIRLLAPSPDAGARERGR